MKFDVDDKNRCRLVCVKFHLNRCRFAVAVAKCLGGSLFLGHSVQRCRVCVCVAVWISWTSCWTVRSRAGRPQTRTTSTCSSSLIKVTHYLRTRKWSKTLDERPHRSGLLAPDRHTHTDHGTWVTIGRTLCVGKSTPKGKLIALKGGKLKVGNPTPEIG